MKKLINLIAVSFLVTSLTGCLKDTPANDFSTISPIIELPYHGLEGFSKDAVFTAGATDPITLPIVVNLASKDVLSKDVTGTLAIDDALRTKYNSLGGNQYETLPDSTYSFPQTAVSIKAGTRLDTLYITFYPDKVDPSKNYMLPIKISEASGATISGNFGAVYFHMIGNPLAGSFIHEWLRWNGQTGAGTGSPTFDETYDDVMAPVDPTTVSFSSNTGTLYILSFKNTNGVLSDFSVSFPASGPGSASDNGITITSGPTIVSADPANKKFVFNFNYNNSSGSPRVIVDKVNP